MFPLQLRQMQLFELLKRISQNICAEGEDGISLLKTGGLELTMHNTPPLRNSNTVMLERREGCFKETFLFYFWVCIQY